jgi:ribosomal protein S18 acetylase RimI-like enzyme
MDADMIPIDFPDYCLRAIDLSSQDAVQHLCEACADFFWLVDGEAVSPGAGLDIFESLPPGRSIEDKFVYGLFNQQDDLLGVLEGLRHYPDEGTWWIGLLLLAPETRQLGLGQKIVRGFIEGVRLAGGTAVQLGVVEDNHAGYQFWRKVGFEPLRTTEPRSFGEKLQVVHVLRHRLE